MRYISLLGSTGSIGRQTLDIVSAHPDQLRVVALAAGSKNLPLLAGQVKTFKPELVCLPDEESALALSRLINKDSDKPEIVHGEQGLIAAAVHDKAQTVVTGVVGFLGLKPTAAAIKKGKTIALANKETLVAAGSAVMPMVKMYGATIVPVDSEHSAIFQCLEKGSELARIWLTASGGPFRTWSRDQINSATIDDALKHPNWAMGNKITIDSATLMNKGLEIIEAKWLFDLDPEFIRVLIHPQSILHSAVEFVDGSIIGQMGLPDMRLPIHYALFHPKRVHSDKVPRLNLVDIGQLTFEEPDLKRFPCLALAKSVAGMDGTPSAVLNAANEIVVAAFLDGHIRFYDIAEQIERVLDRHQAISKPTLEDILEADRWARVETAQALKAASGR